MTCVGVIEVGDLVAIDSCFHRHSFEFTWISHRCGAKYRLFTYPLVTVPEMVCRPANARQGRGRRSWPAGFVASLHSRGVVAGHRKRSRYSDQSHVERNAWAAS